MARRRSVEEQQAHVLRLRAEGLSFSKVAEELKISKAYAVKLSKRSEPVTDRSPQSDTSDRSDRSASDRSPKTRQRRFAKGLVEGKSSRQAAMDAALPAKLSHSGADSYANRTLKDTKFRGTFEQMLDRKGLSEDRIAEIHAENLEATKVVATATKEGQITDVLERPDYATRQRAVQSGWRIRGRDRTDEHSTSNPVVIVVRAETKRNLEQLVGRPLDIEVIDSDDEELPEQTEPQQIEAGESSEAVPDADMQPATADATGDDPWDF
jgi:transposase